MPVSGGETPADTCWTFDFVNTNFKGVFFNIQRALPLLSEGASVILTTSIAAEKGFVKTTVYSATRAAVRSLARTFWLSMAE